MKIRIKGNSIRIRLSRTEVDTFGTAGYLQEQTQVGNGTFTYALQSKDGISALEAAYDNNTMTIFVPAAIPPVWAKDETVGYDNNMDTGNGKLFILLEKDFKCIDNTSEDQSDNFDNPNMTCD